MRRSLILCAAALLPGMPAAAQSAGLDILMDFQPGTSSSWAVVNDGVMGGISSSTIRAGAEGTAVFEGDLSLENNGGFASVRTELRPASLAGASSIVLRVRGDGNRYQVRLRPGRRFDGVAYAAAFETVADEWITVELPTSAFEPTYRGFRPRRVGPIDPSRIAQLGLMLTDKQEGPFQLEIEWIGVRREAATR